LPTSDRGANRKADGFGLTPLAILMYCGPFGTIINFGMELPVSRQDYRLIFTPEALAKVFPPSRADDFFDALFGDAAEGAYDIELVYRDIQGAQNELLFELHLHERPGKCLACNLTYGLPEVFSRHPLLDIKGLAQRLVELLGDNVKCRGWRLGNTQSRSKQLHVIPLSITVG
jgi:hypothetical protein